jgi:capsid protein
MALQSKKLTDAMRDLQSEFRSDYRAGKTSRFVPRLSGVDPAGSGADYHYRSEREFLHVIERAREYERNDCIVRSGIDRLTANVLQEGFNPDPKTGNKELDAKLKEKWIAYSTDPDQVHSEGEFDWYQLERLAFRSIIRDGDCFALPLKTGQIQFVEGHRPRTPSATSLRVVHGLLLDENARRDELWLTREDVGINQVRLVRDIKKYQIRDAEGNRQVWHLYFPRRLSQRRGVSALVPVSDTVGQHDDLQFTTLVKAQMAAVLVMVEELAQSQQSVRGPGLSGPVTGQEASSVSAIPEVGAGLHFKTPNKLTGFAPNIPNPEFFPHAMLLLTFIAINLDLPVQVLLLDPQRASFSSWRAAIDQARVRFREMQKDLCSQLHEPVWKWKVRQWLESDASLAQYLGDGVDPFRCTWKRPSWAYIDPLKDAQADALQAEKFLASMRGIYGKRGADWDEVAVEIVEDKATLIREALKMAAVINSEFPEAALTWRELLGPGLTIPLQPFNVQADASSGN